MGDFNTKSFALPNIFPTFVPILCKQVLKIQYLFTN